MKPLRLTLLALGFLLLSASDCGDKGPTEPRGTATATAECGQNGAGVKSVFCRDQSSDPRGVVVENGVRFEASLIGSAFQASRLTSIRGQVIFDVTAGGFGTYTVDQALLDDQGRVVASESYSVPVVEASSIAAFAVRVGFVEPDNEQAFIESLGRDAFGLEAVRLKLITVDDAITLGEKVFRGHIN